MKLNVMERLLALQLLPSEGSIVMLKVIREAQDKLGLTEEEIKEFGVKQNEGTATWNKEGNEEREIAVSVKAQELLADELKKLDEKKKLTRHHVSLYEKFVMNN